MSWEKIRREYETSDISMADLASKHGVKPSTLRSRKNREKWQQGNATQHKNVATRRNDDAMPKVPKLVIENDDLTEKQKMFCFLYLRYKFNETKAYQEAYGVDYKTANSNAYRLMVNDGVKKEIDRLKLELKQEAYVTTKDMIQEYIKQSFADITDFVEFKVVEEPVRDMFGNKVKDEDTGEVIMKRRNIVEFKDSAEVDGSLIQEVRVGKDGASLKLMDKQKAMDVLMKYVDTAMQQQQLEKLKLENEKLRNEIRPAEGTEDKLSDYMSKLMDVYGNDK